MADPVTDQPSDAPATDEQLAQAVNPKKPTIHVKVYEPFKVHYEGLGYSVSAVNETGPFDILPKHHNFLCMLVPCDVVIQTPNGERVIKVSRALMHVRADSVVVFVDV